MKIPGSGIPGISDKTYRGALSHGHADRYFLGSFLEVSVIEHELFIGRQLVNCDAAAIAVKELDDLAIGGRDDGRSGRCGNIDRVVYTSFRT